MKVQSETFNPKVVIGVIVAGMVAFAVLMLLLAYGAPGGSRPEGRAHVQSVAATGYKGLVDLVGRFRKTAIADGAEDHYGEDLLIVALETTSRPEQISALLGRRQGRATLLILPKWYTVRDPVRRRWVRAVGAGAGAIAGPVLGRRIEVLNLEGGGISRANGRDFLSDLSLPLPARAQLIDGPGLTSLVGRSDGSALVARIENQPHYILADPDLVNNHGLRDPDRARSALALIDALNATGTSGVTFDSSADFAGRKESPNLLKLAFEPPFLAMTLALVIAAVLAGLHGAFRFGPPRAEARAIAFGKAALVENSAGLIRLAQREARMGSAYVDLVRQDVARSTGASPWLSDDETDQYLDRMGKPGQASFSQLADRLRANDDRHSLVAAAHALFQWRKEIIR